MLAMSAPADKPDSRGQTPLMWAASAGNVEAMQALLKAGAKVNRVTGSGFTPLFFAIKSGSVPATQLLLDAGAKADLRGPEKTSAAQLAIYQHAYDVAALFVARGADVGERDRNGNQLLHAAATAGAMPLIEALLAGGADPNGLTGPSRITWVTEANFGQPPPPVPPTTPLLAAARKGQVEAMKRIAAAGGKPGFVEDNGTNVVLAAAIGGSAAALDYALSLAPDANVANADGATPLHLLVGGGTQPELGAMLRVLAAHGARVDIKNKSGVTAADMADGGLTEVKLVFRTVYPAEKGTTLASAASDGRPAPHD
jgi:ankyrin repeat protein